MTPDAKIAMLSSEKDELVCERQALRQDGAKGEDLERNRLRIVQAQWQLSHAFVEAYCAKS
jgi:hypothetical protein